MTTNRPSSSLKLIPSESFPPHTHSISAPAAAAGVFALALDDAEGG